MTILLSIVLALYAASVLAQEQPIHRLNLGMELYDLAWSPDGQLLAVATSEGIHLLTKMLHEVTTLHEHTGHVVSVAWKPDGTQLASSGGIGDGSIRVWDYAITGNSFTLNTTISLSNDFVRVSRVSWSPDGNHLAALGILDSPAASELVAEVRIWDANSWTLESISQDHFVSPTRSLTWSPDSTTVAGGGRTSCYDERISCAGHLGGVYQLDVTNGSLIGGFDLATVPMVVSWSPTGQLAIGAFGLTIADGATNEQIAYWEFTPARLDWSPEGDKIVGYSAGIVQILEIQTGAILRSFEPSGFGSIDWSLQGNRIATGSEDGIIEIWDVSNLPDVSGTPTLTPLPTYTPSHTPTATPLVRGKFKPTTLPFLAKTGSISYDHCLLRCCRILSKILYLSIGEFCADVAI